MGIVVAVGWSGVVSSGSVHWGDVGSGCGVTVSVSIASAVVGSESVIDEVDVTEVTVVVGVSGVVASVFRVAGSGCAWLIVSVTV